MHTFHLLITYSNFILVLKQLQYTLLELIKFDHPSGQSVNWISGRNSMTEALHCINIYFVLWLFGTAWTVLYTRPSFQTLERAFSFLLNPQMSRRVFHILGRVFEKLSWAYNNNNNNNNFETSAWPSLLINGGIKNFWKSGLLKAAFVQLIKALKS